ncbi:hypothetical protein ACFORH_39090 [Amycolatopsis roodepoortensis]|uniref:Uncharacterized protein n=1 Tax=Amycolatopsis roodepoortensis TaxID=700274 RepID=A0ABR9LIK2_9PSEU|nr:hypothetical protein [Amycolatopsis roodepoortensis]MBE1580521.1 hypothetical protein [Amycolatopsis roodepoortensis]
MASSPATQDPRELGLTGWVGEHPINGTDVAHLLLSPRSSTAVAEGVELLAELLGLRPLKNGVMPDIPAVITRAELRGSDVHVLYGDDGDLTRPVTPEWTDAAIKQRFVIVTFGTAPFTGDLAALDRYLERDDRLFVGEIPVTRHTAQA